MTMPVSSVSPYGHAGNFLPGMAGNVLFAVAFHVAVGGVLWLGGSLGEARPAYPVSEVVMVQVITPETVLEPVLPIQPVMVTEPASVSKPEIEPVIDNMALPAQETVTANPDPLPQPAIEIEEDELAEFPVYQVPDQKPVPKPVAQETDPVDVAQTVAIREQEVSQENTDTSRPSPALSATTKQEQGNVSVQQAGISLIAETQASYAHNPKPVYPNEARRRRQEGIVLLQVHVEIDGRVSSVFIKKSSGYRLLDHAAQRAISGWKFIPATLGGIPVQSKAEVPVRFFLNNS